MDNNLFDSVPDEIVVEIIRNHLKHSDDVLNCFVTCKRFNTLIAKYCKEKLRSPNHWFWRVIGKMEQNEQKQFSSIIHELTNFKLNIPQPAIVEDSPKKKKGVVDKMKQALKIAKKTPDPSPTRTEVPTKVLLFGTKQGKRTFAKQMHILAGKEFSENSDTFQSFVVRWLEVLLPLMEHNYNHRHRAAESQVVALKLQQEVKDRASYLMLDLWTDPSVKQKILSVLDELAKDTKFMEDLQEIASETFLDKTFTDTTGINNFLYVLKHRQRIFQPDATFSKLDMLMVRPPRLSALQNEISLCNHKFNLAEFRRTNERRTSWRLLENTHVMLVFVALSDYNVFLREDENLNSMEESLQLSEEILCSRWFKNCLHVTVFTHTDTFKDKIKRVPISKFYPEYTGGCEYEESFHFFASKFEQVYAKAGKPFRCVAVCNLDTESVCRAWLQILNMLKEHQASQDDG